MLHRRVLLLLALALPFGCICLHACAQDKSKLDTFRGKVVSLADALKKQGIELDQDAQPHWLALETEDGKLHPLLKDVGSRMFYRDARLLNRSMQFRGRFVGTTGLLQVLEVHTVKDRKLHEVYYWCEVCAIRRSSLEKTGVCECCGGQMELREVALAKQ